MLEKLLETLAALIAAINANTEALKGGSSTVASPSATSKRSAPAKPEKPADPVYPTSEDVVAACQVVLDTGKGAAPLTELAAKFGVKKLRETAGTAKAVEVIKAVNELAEKLKAEADSAV